MAEEFEGIIPTKTRWLALFAASLSGIAGTVLFGPLFFLVASIQVLGTILQPFSHRLGRWLLLVGAVILSLYAGAFVLPQALGLIRMPYYSHDYNRFILLSLLATAILSLLWSDIMLVVDSIRSRHILFVSSNVFPTAADWIVLAITVCINLYFVPVGFYGAVDYWRLHRLDSLAFCLGLGLATVFFDFALVVDAIKMRRAKANQTSF